MANRTVYDPANILGHSEDTGDMRGHVGQPLNLVLECAFSNKKIVPRHSPGIPAPKGPFSRRKCIVRDLSST